MTPDEQLHADLLSNHKAIGRIESIYSRADCEIARLEVEVERLGQQLAEAKTIVDGLPKTADGNVGDPQGRLIEIAAEMARFEGMPSIFPEDYPTRPTKASLKCAKFANEQCLAWARRLRTIADELNRVLQPCRSRKD
jgi:hypothetical protein